MLNTIIEVEIIYSSESKSILSQKVVLPTPAYVKDALQQARWYEQHPETKGLKIGIFSKIATEKTLLQSDDRIEIYRPLRLDPKDARRLKAQLTK